MRQISKEPVKKENKHWRYFDKGHYRIPSITYKNLIVKEKRDARIEAGCHRN